MRNKEIRSLRMNYGLPHINPCLLRDYLTCTKMIYLKLKIRNSNFKTIACQSKDFPQGKEILKENLEEFNRYLKKWGLKQNSNKTYTSCAERV